MKWKPGETLESLRKEAIMETLKFHGYNRTKTAESLGISIRGLRNCLNRYKKEEVDVPENPKGNYYRGPYPVPRRESKYGY